MHRHYFVLDVIMKELRDCGDIIVKKVQHGRLNQNEPKLHVHLILLTES
jgi:hypothetical protein